MCEVPRTSIRRVDADGVHVFSREAGPPRASSCSGTTNTYDVEALVVGAGPTGMTVASELKRHGMECRIIDRLLQPSQVSKALGIQSRTLELFEKMGRVDDFLAEGVQITTLNIYGARHRIARIDM